MSIGLPKILIEEVKLSYQRGETIDEKSFKYYLSTKLPFFGGGREVKTSLVEALRGVSLHAKAGDIVGIIGENGAGKSTLLKIIAGLMSPDSGRIEIEGTVSSVFGLGAGFKNHLTGRENIYTMGVLYRLSPQEIDEMVEPIIEFAELHEAIDRPLRTYSSGMRTRLGFSILSYIDTDIVVLDEALNAGDVRFQRKVGNLIERFHGDKKILLVVSHAESVIKDYCNRVYYLSKGRIAAEGTAEEVWSTFAKS